jgi:nucleoside-diphosphate-sugar epimerase
MAKIPVLVTGANGEMGHGLIPELANSGDYEIFAVDLAELDEVLLPHVSRFIQTDILDIDQLKEVIDENDIRTVFHLAAILSTGAEADPERAHQVNVNGTINLLSLCKNKVMRMDSVLKFIFPSSIAVYGIPDGIRKLEITAVKEDEYLQPVTMYGINKLYCEHLGRYFSQSYRLTSTEPQKGNLDFRAIRFPGIISALTVPTGGTSDYAPEMIHSAARGDNYESFVRADTKIPFMVMPDAVKALCRLAESPKENLTSNVYNISAFSATAGEISMMVNSVFPQSNISYKPHTKRQSIVDSWPAEVDDSRAKKDWGWSADYTLDKAFKEYLIPTISERYKTPQLQLNS